MRHSSESTRHLRQASTLAMRSRRLCARQLDNQNIPCRPIESGRALAQPPFLPSPPPLPHQRAHTLMGGVAVEFEGDGGV